MGEKQGSRPGAERRLAGKRVRLSANDRTGRAPAPGSRGPTGAGDRHAFTALHRNLRTRDRGVVRLARCAHAHTWRKRERGGQVGRCGLKGRGAGPAAAAQTRTTATAGGLPVVGICRQIAGGGGGGRGGPSWHARPRARPAPARCWRGMYLELGLQGQSGEIYQYLMGCVAPVTAVMTPLSPTLCASQNTLNLAGTSPSDGLAPPRPAARTMRGSRLHAAERHSVDQPI